MPPLLTLGVHPVVVTKTMFLRQVLYQYVPKTLLDRPKMGFPCPLTPGCAGRLREWAQDLLDADRLEREGYFHPEPIRRAWQAHLSGRSNHGQRLWVVLQFQAWLDSQ